MAIYRSFAAAVGLVFLLGSVAYAEDPMTLNAWDMGWYAQSPSDSGHHTPTNLSYFAGRYTDENASYAEEYRNFFIFDLTGLSGTVTSAKLTLTTLLTSQTSEIYELFNVATPLLSLVAGGSGQSTIFDDLGTGASYGSCTVSESPAAIVEIALNTAFRLDATNALGNRIAIGGALTTLSPGSEDEYVFGYNGHSRQLNEAQLTLTIEQVPEPTTFVLLLIGAASMFAWMFGRRSAISG